MKWMKWFDREKWGAKPHRTRCRFPAWLTSPPPPRSEKQIWSERFPAWPAHQQWLQRPNVPRGSCFWSSSLRLSLVENGWKSMKIGTSDLGNQGSWKKYRGSCRSSIHSILGLVDHPWSSELQNDQINRRMFPLETGKSWRHGMKTSPILDTMTPNKL